MDAATKLKEQVAGLGVVIRSLEGNFVAVAQKQVRYFGDVTAAETEAIKLGIETAEAANCVPLMIECDCREAVDLALGRKGSNTEICWTILDIQEKLKELQNLTLQHASRLHNGMAHSIAKVALESVEPIMWFIECHTHLLYLFQS